MDLVHPLCMNHVQNLLGTQVECSSILLLHVGAILVQYSLDVNG